MKKEYAVSVDITVSKTVYVHAENEDEALKLGRLKVSENPHYHASTADAYVDHFVVDVNEVED